MVECTSCTRSCCADAGQDVQLEYPDDTTEEANQSWQTDSSRRSACISTTQQFLDLPDDERVFFCPECLEKKPFTPVPVSSNQP
jgi:hypothetical protein